MHSIWFIWNSYRSNRLIEFVIFILSCHWKIFFFLDVFWPFILGTVVDSEKNNFLTFLIRWRALCNTGQLLYLKNLNTIKSLWFSTETGEDLKGIKMENLKFSPKPTKFDRNGEWQPQESLNGGIKFELKYWLSSLLKRTSFCSQVYFRNESIQFYRKCHVFKETFLLKLPTVNCHCTEN